MLRRSFLAFAAALLAALPAAAQDGPVALVREVYRVHAQSEKTNLPAWFNPHRERFFVKRLVWLLARDEAQNKIGFDFIYDGQDYKISELSFALVSQSADAAVVEARFKNFGEPKRLSFALRREDGAWKIADITARGKNGWRLTKLLTGK